LVRKHLERGDSIRVLVRDPGAAICRLPSVRSFQGDLVRAGTIPADFVAHADVLYHCAAEIRDERLMEAANVHGTRALGRLAAGRVGRWVQVSSASVYGATRSGVVTEDSPLRPDSVYGRTKVESEEVVRSAAAAGGFGVSILRPSNIFGAGMPSNALYKLFGAIERGWFFPIGKPGAVMNYVHVDNVVAAAVLCATHPAATGRAYNVSDEMPLEQLAATVAEELGTRPSALRLPEAPLRVLASVLGLLPGIPLTHRHLDALTARARYASERIHHELAYRPAISFEAGLRELVRGWKRGRRGG
jgi:nucleoside-diphosphate-sugar epimerase